MKHKDTFTEALKKAVIKHGLTQYEFAKVTGHSNRILGRFLHENCDIRLSTVEDLLKVLELRIELKHQNKE